ncbi:MAG: chloride channel protein [Pirellulales bacterium]|nr:chloride channel protein [Pirellulales bacterium]
MRILNNRLQGFFPAFGHKLRTVFDLESSGRVIVFSALVGVVAGLGAAAFLYFLVLLQGYALGHIEGYYPPAAGTEPISHVAQMPTNWLAVLLVPVFGGIVCGCIVYCFAPEAEGHGTDAMVKAFHSLGGRIRARVPLVKTLASIVTIGTGGSAGREGPIAQIGAGFGSFLSDRLKLSDWERRMLILSGAAGGVGAIFRAPLGGALFAVEVLYASTAVEFSAIVPCVVASVVAYSVFSSIYGPGLAFIVPETLSFEGPSELPFYLVFAIICAVSGFLYIWCFYGLRDHFFRRLPVPNHIKPAIGGLLLGLVALWFPQVMAGGYGWIQEAINGNMTLKLMAMLVVAKILATSFTISSGGSGGVFAPSLFIGAMLGGAFGLLCNTMFPGVAPPAEAFVLVGMGGFFAGVAKVPLTALIMVSEMSGSYDLLVPLMLVSVINVAVLSSRWSLYEEQVPSLIDSPAHLGDYVVDVLEGMVVREIYNPSRLPTLIHEDIPLQRVLRMVAHSKESYFPVVDENEDLVGIFSLHDIRSAFVNKDAGNLILASDLASSSVVTVTPEDNLHTTLRLCTQKNITEIPVVDVENPKHVICMLSRQEVLTAYDERMSALRNGQS